MLRSRVRLRDAAASAARAPRRACVRFCGPACHLPGGPDAQSRNLASAQKTTAHTHAPPSTQTHAQHALPASRALLRRVVCAILPAAVRVFVLSGARNNPNRGFEEAPRSLLFIFRTEKRHLRRVLLF